uniref:PCNA-associated factor n=1 Tax=Macaca fascicularis TaxID=9541 RepID=A0A7N9CTN0_MACFA
WTDPRCKKPRRCHHWALAIGSGGTARNQWEPWLRRVLGARGKETNINCGGRLVFGSLSSETPSVGWEVSWFSHLLSSCLNMVRTKADSVPGTYRKVVAARAPRKVLGSSTSATNSTPVSSRKGKSPPKIRGSGLAPASPWLAMNYFS